MSWRLKEKARLTLADEIGTVYKHGQDVKIALAYPNTYWIGMSCLGFHSVYRILNQRIDTLCERVFLPEDCDIPEYIRTNTPLFTLEHQRPVYEFDILAFSLYFEEDYLRILKILELSKIPLMSSLREELPLVIGGGPIASSNPEPIAPFFDLFILGDAEEILNEFIQVFREVKGLGLPKGDCLRELSKIDGVYVPKEFEEIYEFPQREVRPRYIKILDLYPTSSLILTPHTEFGDRHLVEITRGCPHGCRFCMLRFTQHPFRYRGHDAVYEEVRRGLQHTRRIGLVGSGEGDYPGLDELLRRIKDKGGEVSLGSLRLDAITHSILSELNQWTLTLAPEAGTERLRKIIGKGISDEEIIERIKMIPDSIPNLKLYFMIGLPGEKNEDIEGIVNLVKRIMATSPNKRFTISIAPFVPKPHTPFQWRRMEEEEVLEDRIQIIKDGLGRHLRIVTGSVKGAIFQAILARGDRQLSKLLYRIHLNGMNWKRALVEEGIDPRPYLEGWGGYEGRLPWDHIATGPPKAYLVDQDRRV